MLTLRKHATNMLINTEMDSILLFIIKTNAILKSLFIPFPFTLKRIIYYIDNCFIVVLKPIDNINIYTTIPNTFSQYIEIDTFGLTLERHKK